MDCRRAFGRAVGDSDYLMTDSRFDLIIAFRDRGSDHHRAANLASAVRWWRDHGVEPLVVDDGRSGTEQFNRSAAYNRGAAMTTAPVLVYSEADMLVPMDQILEAVELATEEPGLVIPFSRFMSMDKDDSCRVRDRTLHPFDAKAEQVRGDCQSIGAVNVMSRDSLSMIGQFDSVFSGHAYDDDATELAFRICCGPTRFVRGPGWHQWHVPGAFYATPESTEQDRAATERNRQRYELYRAATTPERIRELTGGSLA